MLCRDCGYALQGLREHACPECGTPFDPANPLTFDTGARTRGFLLAAWVALSPAWVHMLSGHLGLLIARGVLGRWPIRGGADDPKSIDGLFLPHALWWFTLVLLIPSLIASGILVATALGTLGTRRARSLCLLVGATWALAFVLVKLDPAQVGVWMLD